MHDAMRETLREMDRLRMTIAELSRQVVEGQVREEQMLSEFSAMNNELITTQRLLAKSNAELKGAKDEAERADAAKSRFLAMASHELRTPLNGIMGMTELLRSMDCGPGQTELLEGIADSGEHLLVLIHNLLDLSQAEAGRMKLHETPFALCPMLKRTSDMLGVAAAKRGNVITIQVAEAVHCGFVADGGKLRQIIVNLLGNAVKFTDKGSIHVGVYVLDDREPEQLLRFEVKDTGRGISAEDCARLFQPYTRMENAGEAVEGTGLGLSICKMMVELMGGSIGVESEPGRGSLFWFELPLRKDRDARPAVKGASGTGNAVKERRHAEPELADGQDLSYAAGLSDPSHARAQSEISDASGHSPLQAGTASAGSASMSAYGELTVLMAEDDPLNAKLLELQLKQLGFRDIRHASGGGEALRLWEAAGADLVLLDSRLPEMHGAEVASAIRDRESAEGAPRVPIVAVTGSSAEEDLQRLRDAGCDECLVKPLKLEQLRGMIERLLPDAGASVVNAGTVHEIRELDPDGSMGVWTSLLDTFRGDTPSRIGMLTEAVLAGELEAGMEAAHSLKSGALSLGADYLASLCGRIELYARRGEADRAAGLLPRLMPAYEEAVRMLQHPV